jgi:monoamine oxidase
VVRWWQEPFSRGAYSYPVAGALGAPGALAAPVAGTLFFAGEATCGERHPATVHGAIETGWRAAQEVAEAIA